MSTFQISEQPNIFDDHLLDIFGSQFKFDHAKGLAEWIKNSSDAYNRELDEEGAHRYSDEDQFIYLRLRPKSAVNLTRFECIDFVGMTHAEIENAFKRWGDPEAASRGRGRKKILGGHGNGGKFYMRQMFEESRFITYRNGKLNMFGFNEKKKYGFVKEYENKRVKLKRALQIAELDDLIPKLPKIVRNRLEKEETGFTVVIGEGPHKIQRKNAPRSILNRLCFHPQARRLIRDKQIFAVVADQPIYKLQVETIPPRMGFETPVIYDVPKRIEYGGSEIELANDKFPAGKLVLKTSHEPFTRLGDRASLNCIDIISDIGVIASYRMHELGQIRNHSETEFIYGECSCPILEDPTDRCVNNDREKLIDTEKTTALLEWVAQKVNELADKMAEKSKDEQKAEELKQSSTFNEFLNSWMRKSKFWETLRGEIYGGNGDGSGFGGTGGGEPTGKGKGSSDKKVKPETDEELGGGAGIEKKSGSKFPDVRLSNCDPDPLGFSPTVNCEPGHPPVYQRDVDVQEGVFWINTQSPFARRIRESRDYGPDSTRWREYMFQRHIDILIKQAIYETEKRESGITAPRVEYVLDKISKQVYAAAAEDPSLESFLFRETLSGGMPLPSESDQLPTETPATK